ncbi:MAG: hypothetical protein ACR2QO_27435 [Acidimicrobiales bacterium]
MAYTTASIQDQSDKTAVVTGANGGLGLEIAKGLAGASSVGSPTSGLKPAA